MVSILIKFVLKIIMQCVFFLRKCSVYNTFLISYSPTAKRIVIYCVFSLIGTGLIQNKIEHKTCDIKNG